MPRFTVTLTQLITACAVVEVEAADELGAQLAALQTPPDALDFEECAGPLEVDYLVMLEE